MNKKQSVNIWPKKIEPLSPEQQAIGDDFMRYWLEILPKRYSLVENFNHRYPVKHILNNFLRTLEIGAGLGAHLEYEKLTSEQLSNYFSLDIRENVARNIRQKYPQVHTVVADCQQKLPFADSYFDRILAIHVLEHLPNLPATIKEMKRLLNPDQGFLSVVIPCEGGLAYGLARRISAQRIFEKKYKQSYRWLIEREHINLPREIMQALREEFYIVERTWFPFKIPSVNLNICIGLTLRPRN